MRAVASPFDALRANFFKSQAPMPVHASFLKYFSEVCKTGSIRKAARNLYVASSAVNRQILKVENELGVKLFERSHAGIKLTLAGELLAKHVDFTLADFERTRYAIAAMGSQAKKRLTIVGQESVIARFLPPALVAVHARFPEVSTSFKAAGGIQLNDMLLNGVADIALAFDPPSVAGIVRFAEARIPVGAVLAAGHPISGETQLSLQACAQYPLILPDRSWPLRQLIDREIQNAGIKANIKTSSNSVEFLRAMLDLEQGIGFQTAIGIETEIEQGLLVHVPLHSPAPVTQTFAICVREDTENWEPFAFALTLLASKLLDY